MEPPSCPRSALSISSQELVNHTSEEGLEAVSNFTIEIKSTCSAREPALLAVSRQVRDEAIPLFSFQISSPALWIVQQNMRSMLSVGGSSGLVRKEPVWSRNWRSAQTASIRRLLFKQSSSVAHSLTLELDWLLWTSPARGGSMVPCPFPYGFPEDSGEGSSSSAREEGEAGI